jgi:tyrosyl-tRNA synthetase
MLLLEAGFAASKSEARRLIDGGGAKLNDNGQSKTRRI